MNKKYIDINTKEIENYINNRLAIINKESISLQINQDNMKLEIQELLQKPVILSVEETEINKREKRVRLNTLNQNLNINNTKLVKLMGQITEVKQLMKYIEQKQITSEVINNENKSIDLE